MVNIDKELAPELVIVPVILNVQLELIKTTIASVGGPPSILPTRFITPLLVTVIVRDPTFDVNPVIRAFIFNVPVPFKTTLFTDATLAPKMLAAVIDDVVPAPPFHVKTVVAPPGILPVQVTFTPPPMLKVPPATEFAP
jgi:hypothetical protein